MLRVFSSEGMSSRSSVLIYAEQQRCKLSRKTFNIRGRVFFLKSEYARKWENFYYAI